jgi:hypothetical protein
MIAKTMDTKELLKIGLDFIKEGDYHNAHINYIFTS